MELLDLVFGLGGPPQNTGQMLARSVLVFLATLALLRTASRRFLGRYSAFDWVLSIILGSVLSRTINGTAPLFPTLAAATALLALHWSIGALAARFPAVCAWIHGEPKVVVDRGKVLERELRRHQLTREDLLEELRYELHTERIERVRRGVLERNGRISIVEE